jgi:probable rRNA maturation factor
MAKRQTTFRPNAPARISSRITPPRAPHPFKLDIAAVNVPRPATLIRFLRRHLRSAHAVLGYPLDELSVALVNDERMSALHTQFLGIPGPTDVLTFELAYDKSKRPTSGEVVVCIPEARRAIALRRTALELEVLLYCLHGMLHLCGYDDRRSQDYELMHRTEDDLLSRLGLPAVFAGHGRELP